jgi:hypothetical protein
MEVPVGSGVKNQQKCTKSETKPSNDNKQICLPFPVPGIKTKSTTLPFTPSQIIFNLLLSISYLNVN